MWIVGFLHTRERRRSSVHHVGFVKRLMKVAAPLGDVFLAPLLVPAAGLMKLVRRAGVERLPLCRKVLSAFGVFPVADHYYEPLIEFSSLRHPLDQRRNLPGIDMNVDGQLALLGQFRFSEELRPLTELKKDELTYNFGNGFFDSGDAEFLYNLIRLRKPARIVEIGSGHSTLIAIEALRNNKKDDAEYRCEHICIEPYEAPWLERSGVAVRRERVETVDRSVFERLTAGDLLFIDSSHVIRPQGDVLCEFLEIIPALKKGVLVHVHDVFTPRDYPKSWVVDKVRLWNEQYLLEALLTGNPSWSIVGALNFLHHEHHEQLAAVCPFLTDDREPCSFYIERVAE